MNPRSDQVSTVFVPRFEYPVATISSPPRIASTRLRSTFGDGCHMRLSSSPRSLSSAGMRIARPPSTETESSLPGANG